MVIWHGVRKWMVSYIWENEPYTEYLDMGWKTASLRFVRSQFGCHRPLKGVAIGTANLWLVAAVGL